MQSHSCDAGYALLRCEMIQLISKMGIGWQKLEEILIIKSKNRIVSHSTSLGLFWNFRHTKIPPPSAYITWHYDFAVLYHWKYTKVGFWKLEKKETDISAGCAGTCEPLSVVSICHWLYLSSRIFSYILADSSTGPQVATAMPTALLSAVKATTAGRWPNTLPTSIIRIFPEVARSATFATNSESRTPISIWKTTRKTLLSRRRTLGSVRRAMWADICCFISVERWCMAGYHG
jgi:hypothetical protein